MLKEALVSGKLPGLLQFVIDDPESALEKYKTSRRYGIKKDK